jgi:hypothetical protein
MNWARVLQEGVKLLLLVLLIGAIIWTIPEQSALVANRP